MEDYQPSRQADIKYCQSGKMGLLADGDPNGRAALLGILSTLSGRPMKGAGVPESRYAGNRRSSIRRPDAREKGRPVMIISKPWDPIE